MLRILQEALTNVLKHSRAAGVDITISCGDPRLRMVGSDNGTGFDTQSPALVTGSGLRSMQRRAQRLGGSFDVRREGERTVLVVQIPWPGTLRPAMYAALRS